MDWKEINIPISSKISSEDIYKTFRNELKVDEYVLLALQDISTKKISYVTMLLDDERTCAIIAEEELYYWYNCTIVAYCLIEPYHKDFYGEIYINDVLHETYNNEEELISEYNRLINFKKQEFGEPEWNCSGFDRGCCSFVDNIGGKSCYLYYKHN